MPEKTAHPEPFKSFRFLVEVEGGGKAVMAAFTQFSGVKMRVETVQARAGAENRGVKDNVPATTSFENVTFTKGVIGDNEFLDWILASAPGAANGPTGKNKYRTINVIALDEKGNRGVTWSLSNALPVAYELAPMDSSQSAVLSESIEFAITGFRRVARK